MSFQPDKIKITMIGDINKEWIVSISGNCGLMQMLERQVMRIVELDNSNPCISINPYVGINLTLIVLGHINVFKSLDFTKKNSYEIELSETVKGEIICNTGKVLN